MSDLNLGEFAERVELRQLHGELVRINGIERTLVFKLYRQG